MRQTQKARKALQNASDGSAERANVANDAAHNGCNTAADCTNRRQHANDARGNTTDSDANRSKRTGKTSRHRTDQSRDTTDNSAYRFHRINYGCHSAANRACNSAASFAQQTAASLRCGAERATNRRQHAWRGFGRSATSATTKRAPHHLEGAQLQNQTADCNACSGESSNHRVFFSERGSAVQHLTNDAREHSELFKQRRQCCSQADSASLHLRNGASPRIAHLPNRLLLAHGVLGEVDHMILTLNEGGVHGGQQTVNSLVGQAHLGKEALQRSCLSLHAVHLAVLVELALFRILTGEVQDLTAQSREELDRIFGHFLNALKTARLDRLLESPVVVGCVLERLRRVAIEHVQHVSAKQLLRSDVGDGFTRGVKAHHLHDRADRAYARTATATAVRAGNLELFHQGCEAIPAISTDGYSHITKVTRDRFEVANAQLAARRHFRTTDNVERFANLVRIIHYLTRFGEAVEVLDQVGLGALLVAGRHQNVRVTNGRLQRLVNFLDVVVTNGGQRIQASLHCVNGGDVFLFLGNIKRLLLELLHLFSRKIQKSEAHINLLRLRCLLNTKTDAAINLRRRPHCSHALPHICNFTRGVALVDDALTQCGTVRFCGRTRGFAGVATLHFQNATRHSALFTLLLASYAAISLLFLTLRTTLVLLFFT